MKPLLEAPANDSSRTYETLGYLAAYDAVLNCDYAFLAYKETERDSGEWRVRIRSSQTAGAVFEPAMIRNKARETSAQGRPWFQWGYEFTPSAGDPRQITFRVHVQDGAAREIEMVVQMRKADHSPAPVQSLRFRWPD